MHEEGASEHVRMPRIGLGIVADLAVAKLMRLLSNVDPCQTHPFY